MIHKIVTNKQRFVPQEVGHGFSSHLSFPRSAMLTVSICTFSKHLLTNLFKSYVLTMQHPGRGHSSWVSVGVTERVCL